MSRNISFIIAVLVGMILLAQAKMNFKTGWSQMGSAGASEADTIQISDAGSLTGDSAEMTCAYQND